jgi:hypothetical protein
MSLFLLIITIGALLFFWSIYRGKIYVKAYHYIKSYKELIKEGKDQFEASLLANSLVDVAFNSNSINQNQMIVEAKTYSEVFCGGKQLPIINTARAMGFSK